MLVHPENLVPGTLVTVMRGPILPTHSWWGVSGSKREDRSYNGCVLRVLALSLPFVATELLTDATGEKYSGRRIVFDTRQIRFTEVDEEFAQAMLGNAAKPVLSSHASDASPYSMTQFINDAPVTTSKRLGYCVKCGGDNWDHTKTCPNNPKRKNR